jgi:hypothetical protein
MSPHYPAFWDESGNEIFPEKEPFYGGTTDPETYSKAEYAELYRGQVIHLNRVLRTVIEDLLSNTSRPLIVVLQSDHGPQSELWAYDIHQTDHRERMSILNAIYFWDRRYDQLSSDISPVNTFRVILNTYFGAQLPLLENRHYYSTWSRPYEFYNISELLDGPSQAQNFDWPRFNESVELASSAAGRGDWVAAVAHTRESAKISLLRAERSIVTISNPFFENPDYYQSGISYYQEIESIFPNRPWLRENIRRLRARLAP